MLILAGVSINAIVGDNGIITNAQSANMKSGMAALEEWLQGKYVENFDNVNEYTDKIDGLLYGTDMKKFFQRAANNDMFFLDSTTYKEYYFIEKASLPDKIKNNLVGGNTSLTGKTMYAEFNDIYGVTPNLEVYYCSDGYGSWIGKEDTSKETNLRRTIANSDSGWGEVLGIGKTDVTLSDLKATNGKLVINKSDLDLNFLVNVPNLNRLEFVNCSYTDLKGLEYASDVTILFFEGTVSINDYSEVGKLKKLQELYFVRSNNNEISKCFSKNSTGIGNYDFEYLTKLGITNDDNRVYWSSERRYLTEFSDINTIEPIKNLSKITRSKVTHINIVANSITSLEVINQFPNLTFLKAGYNNITSLNGISGLKSLSYIILFDNKLGFNLESNSEMDDSVDSLHAIATIKTTADKYEDYIFENTLPDLTYLDLRNNTSLIWINYLKDCTNLKYLYLSGDSNIDVSGMLSLKAKFNSDYLGYSYESKYDLSLKPITTENLNLTDQEYSKDIFESLKQYTNLKQLNLKNIKLYKMVDETKTYITGEELNNLANSVLGTFSKMQALGLNGWSTLNDISFVSKMTYLNNVDLRCTAVTTGTTKTREIPSEIEGEEPTIETYNTGLECLNNKENMYSLAIDEATIDLSKIQSTINRLGIDKRDREIYPEGFTALVNIPGQSTGVGLRCESNSVLGTLSKCSDIDRFISRNQNWGGVQKYSISIDLSECTNLKYWDEYWTYGVVYTMPSSLISLRSGPSSGNAYKLEACTNLKTINLSEVTNETVFKTIRAYTSLEKIRVDSAVCAKALINNVDNWSKCTGLKELEICQSDWWYYNMDVSSLKFMEKLSELTNLNILYMRYVNVTDGDWSYLSNLSHLTKLTIINSEIADISGLNSMTNLKYVNLNNSKVVNGLYALHGKNDIKTIFLKETPVGDLSEYNGANYNTIDILLSLRPANGGSLTDWNFGKNQTDAEKARMK